MFLDSRQARNEQQVRRECAEVLRDQVRKLFVETDDANRYRIMVRNPEHLAAIHRRKSSPSITEQIRIIGTTASFGLSKDSDQVLIEPESNPVVVNGKVLHLAFVAIVQQSLHP